MVTNVHKMLESLEYFLEQKNNNYGDSIAAPINIFSKEPPETLLFARIDDKLKRIKNSNYENLRKNDVVDLIGYLVRLCVLKGWISFKDLID